MIITLSTARRQYNVPVCRYSHTLSFEGYAINVGTNLFYGSTGSATQIIITCDITTWRLQLPIFINIGMSSEFLGSTKSS